MIPEENARRSPRLPKICGMIIVTGQYGRQTGEIGKSGIGRHYQNGHCRNLKDIIEGILPEDSQRHLRYDCLITRNQSHMVGKKRDADKKYT